MLIGLIPSILWSGMGPSGSEVCSVGPLANNEQSEGLDASV